MSTQNVSSSLLWSLVRNFNSKQVRRNNGFVSTTFSKEKGNLLNANSSKFSALVNPVSYNIRSAKTGFSLTVRRRRHLNRPKTSITATTQKNARKSKVSRALAGLTTRTPTLKTAAVRRWNRIYSNNKKHLKRLALKQKATKKVETKKTVNDVN